MRFYLCLIPLAALIGCTQFPELDNVVDPSVESAEFPQLVPLEPLLSHGNDTAITTETQAALAGRAARLKARAARLRAAAKQDNS